MTKQQTREQRIDAHVLETGIDRATAADLIDQQERAAGLRAESAEAYHRAVAEAELRQAANRRAAEEEAARLAAADRVDADAVPVEDNIDADEEVAELERRIASGDQAVTAEDLAEERARAAGRVRFARLRGVFRDREERKAAEVEEVRRAKAADAHARKALAPYAPAELAAKYDAAVAAVQALGEALDGRNKAIRGLVGLPQTERPRGAAQDRGVPQSARIVLDGATHRWENPAFVIKRALEVAGISTRNYGVISRDQFAVTTADPALIAEGRAA